MNDPVWLGNYIVPRWEALTLVGGAAVVTIIISVCALAFIIAMISWLVNPTAKPGNQ